MRAALWTLRLSSTTTCPGRKVGPNCSAMYHSKVVVSLAPSISHGTCNPSGVRAATKVTLWPWLRGTAPPARRLCGAQPYSRVKAMWVPLSSTKTNCSGSRWATASRQAVRAASSRSLAASAFFCASSPGAAAPATW